MRDLIEQVGACLLAALLTFLFLSFWFLGGFL